MKLVWLIIILVVSTLIMRGVVFSDSENNTLNDDQKVQEKKLKEFKVSEAMKFFSEINSDISWEESKIKKDNVWSTQMNLNSIELIINIAGKTKMDITDYVYIKIKSDQANSQKIFQDNNDVMEKYVTGFMKTFLEENIVKKVDDIRLENIKKWNGPKMDSSHGEVIILPYRFHLSLHDGNKIFPKSSWKFSILHKEYDKELNPQKYETSTPRGVPK